MGQMYIKELHFSLHQAPRLEYNDPPGSYLGAFRGSLQQANLSLLSAYQAWMRLFRPDRHPEWHSLAGRDR